MGKGKLNTFSDNVQAIESVWNAVSVDAQRIVGLLDGSVLFVVGFYSDIYIEVYLDGNYMLIHFYLGST